jgi:hypothetical protein
MEAILPQAEVLVEKCNSMLAEAPAPAPLYVFVPAHGESRIAAVHHGLGRILAEDLGQSVLLAEFCPAQSNEGGEIRPCRRGPDFPDLEIQTLTALEDAAGWLEQARRRFDVILADVSQASPSETEQLMRHADAIFFLARAEPGSLHLLRDRLSVLRRWGVQGKCGMLLIPVPNGLRPDLAEELTDLPVCSLVETASQLKQLAGWLAPAGE